MKSSKWTTYVFVLFTLFGCKQLLFKKMVVTQPQLETAKSITRFLHKNKVPKDIAVYVFSKMDFFNEACRNDLSIPEASFFNEQGYFVDYMTSPIDSNTNVEPFLINASSINEMPCDSSNHLSKYEGQLKNLQTNEDLIFSNEAPINAYVIIHWAKFLGEINLNKSFDWINIIKKANENENNIKLIFLNCDYQKAWNISETDIPKFNYLE